MTLRTNRAKALVPLDEIIPGGPPPDGIPAIDRPNFVVPADASAWLKPKEPVLALTIGGDARAYPLQILMWHEIVNDVVGGVPVTVTFCPLCNSALVFERAVDGAILDFGTSGMLYKSDLVMYDRQSHSLWSQMEGRAIVGDRAGTQLTARPVNTIAFEDWYATYPQGKVLSRATGHRRSYGVNPYESYDEPTLGPFLYHGKLDPRRPPKERVVGVAIGEARRAYPFPLLEKHRVAHDTVGGQAIVIFYQPGTLSALDDSEIAKSRAVGATAVFSARHGDRPLTFEATPEGFRDGQTGSRWSFFGAAVSGRLAGQRLMPVQHVDAFWFAWAAFNPMTTLWTGP
ncbi:MAG: DUF3179 domain-containing protein [Candidatus Rokuibacteriota bacterium]